MGEMSCLQSGLLEEIGLSRESHCQVSQKTESLLEGCLVTLLAMFQVVYWLPVDHRIPIMLMDYLSP
jgi:hypothetical protein